MRESFFRYDGVDREKIAAFEWKSSKDSKERFALQIIPGLADHAARYAEVAKSAVEAGGVVYANDHRGHGRTSEGGILGHFGDQDGWEKVVGDTRLLTEFAHNKHSGIPLFLLGHSMGSFVARELAAKCGEYYRGVILSGTSSYNTLLGFIGGLVIRSEIRKRGLRGPSKKMKDFTFGAYNKAFMPPKTEFDWLSRDENRVREYTADPFCGFTGTAAIYRDVRNGLKKANSSEVTNSVRKDLPILITSGNSDPVGNFGKGVKRVYRQYKRAGLEDVTLNIYRFFRHEIYNELTDDEDPTQDMLNWIMERLRNQST